ncbi:MAG: DUF4097 domain-containing protein [bacterium]
MKRQFARLIVVKALFAVVVFCLCNTAFAQELTKRGRYYVAEITKSFKVKKGGALIIYDVRGDVRVRTWDKEEVFIKEQKSMDVFTEKEAKTVLEKSKSSYQQNGNTIEIGGEYYTRDWIKSEFEITVPRVFMVDIRTRSGDIAVRQLIGEVNLKTSGGEIVLEDIDGEIDAYTSGGNIEVLNSTKRARIKTSGGDLELENIGGPLVAKTSGGDIVLTGSKGRLELHTSGGDIEIKDAGGEVKAHTSGGDIEVNNTQGDVEVHTSGGDIDLRNIGGRLEASTSGGDIKGDMINGGVHASTSGGSIELQDVKGGVEGKTAGGDISVEITLEDFKKNHSVDLRTAGGEIVLYIPERLPATIRAEIKISDRWDDYNIYSDFPLTSTEDTSEERKGRRHSRRRRYVRSEGDINGGGNFIELYTTNGDIHIKKLRK